MKESRIAVGVGATFGCSIVSRSPGSKGGSGGKGLCLIALGDDRGTMEDGGETSLFIEGELERPGEISVVVDACQELALVDTVVVRESGESVA